MQKRSWLVSRVLALSALLSIGGAVAHAAPNDKGGHGAEGEHGKAHGNQPGAPEDQGKDKNQRKDKDDTQGDKAGGAEKDELKGDKTGNGDKDDKGREDGRHGRHMGPNGMRELLAELGTGKLKKEDVKARLDALRQERDERAKEHRQELKSRYGSTLALPAVREELEHHARRIARLDRAMFVCETEVKKDKDKLKEHISKLIARENERHDKAMAHFKSMAPTPGASAATPATSAAPAKAGE